MVMLQSQNTSYPLPPESDLMSSDFVNLVIQLRTVKIQSLLRKVSKVKDAWKTIITCINNMLS